MENDTLSTHSCFIPGFWLAAVLASARGCRRRRPKGVVLNGANCVRIYKVAPLAYLIRI